MTTLSRVTILILACECSLIVLFFRWLLQRAERWASHQAVKAGHYWDNNALLFVVALRKQGEHIVRLLQNAQTAISINLDNHVLDVCACVCV